MELSKSSPRRCADTFDPLAMRARHCLAFAWSVCTTCCKQNTSSKGLAGHLISQKVGHNLQLGMLGMYIGYVGYVGYVSGDGPSNAISYGSDTEI